MNITLEKVGNASAVITMKLEKADYEDNVKKSLKNFCAKAQMPGFRPGHVPMTLAKKMYGTQIKAEEVNKLAGEKLMAYIRENHVNMLGEPLPSERQVAQDIEKQDEFEFLFDIALAPEFSVTLGNEDHVDYYDIEVSDESISSTVNQMTNQGGRHEQVDSYQDRDLLRGILAELDENGQPKENGLQVPQASLMPAFFKDEEQKKIFESAKVNDVITFNVAKAYAGHETEIAALLRVKKEETAQYTGDFSFQVEEISRFVPAELNQEFFDQVYGEGVVKTEEEFRGKVREQIAQKQEADSDFKFLLDLRKYLENKVGELEFPDALLKRIMKQNNPEKDEAFVEENYAKSIEELKWHLIKEQLVTAHHIQVNDDDLKATAIQATRFQFAQYGMNHIPDEYLESYAQEMLKKPEQVRGLVDRCIENKLVAALKNVVTLDRRPVSLDDFGKLFEEPKAE